jgi:hypothetical protein
MTHRGALTNVKPPTHSAFGGRSDASRISRQQTAKSIRIVPP